MSVQLLVPIGGAAAPQQKTGVERALSRVLGLFAKVEPSEVLSTTLLTLTVFLLLTAYYLLKTAREPLILLHGGAEVKSYAAAGQAVLLLGVVHAYSQIARRVSRLRLIAVVYVFFASNLVVFAALVRARVVVGVPFFLWVGVFNYTAIAQFWAYASDIFLPAQGTRLFAILGIGSSVGAVVGARIARAMANLGPDALMLLAAVILLVCVALYAQVERREAARKRGPREQAAPVGAVTRLAENPFRLLLRDRYLLFVAGLTLVLNWCNANGEYILDRTLLASVRDGHAQGMTPAAFISAFKADYFAWINAVGVLVQLFLVSRIIHRLGVRTALLVLPFVCFAGYGLVLVAPMLALIRVAKVAENSLDYSLQNTSRQALYLVTSRPEKYVGKTLVDTFLVRSGDALSALVVLVGSRVGVSTRSFAAINLFLVGIWVLLVFRIGREYHRRSAETEGQLEEEPVSP